MTYFFEFEADFVDTLRCIPMMVRFKLDTCGIKLKLAVWTQMSPAERQQLIDLPCNTSDQISYYQAYLGERIRHYTNTEAIVLPIDPAPAWSNSNQLPSQIRANAADLGYEITLSQWQGLTELQRFALVKLSLSRHENLNFLPALQEFQVIRI